MQVTFKYQWRALFLMALAWAFGGLAHNSVSFLFPYMSKVFHLSTQHNGYLTATLALFWTLSIIVCGQLANTKGQIQVMVPGLCVGAAALILMGLAQNTFMLYVCIAVAGFGCGSICSPSLAFLAEQSDPKKRGLFFGVAMSCFTFVGSAVGSVVFTRLGASAIGWRGSYIVMGSMVMAAAMLIFLMGRKIPRNLAGMDEEEEAHHFRELFAYKNVILSTVLACALMMWFFVVASFTILYLMEAKALSAVAAGAIFAGFGTGGFVGEFSAPTISDYIGRKTTLLIATFIGGLCFVAFMLVNLPPVMMTLTIAGASFFISGAAAISNSVVPSESVPPSLVSTVTSFSPAAGEFMGGVVAPVLVGTLSTVMSLTNVMYLLMALPVFVFIGIFFLKETAPRVLAKRK